METIGNRIRKKRKERGFNQEGLAKVVNKSKQVISNWERGYSKPVDDDLLSLSLALDVSADYLLGLKAKETSIEVSDTDPNKNKLLSFVQENEDPNITKVLLDAALQMRRK